MKRYLALMLLLLTAATCAANKDIIIPAGYYVSGITVANTLVSSNTTIFTLTEEEIASLDVSTCFVV